MRLATLSLAIAVMLAAPVFANPSIIVENGFATAAGAKAVAGAAYFTIRNTGSVDDRLTGVASPAASRAMLHATVANGAVMGMTALADGVAIAAGGSHRFETGGDHVMLMGLTHPLAQGDIVELTLTFALAGEVLVEIPVDNARHVEGVAQ